MTTVQITNPQVGDEVQVFSSPNGSGAQVGKIVARELDRVQGLEYLVCFTLNPAPGEAMAAWYAHGELYPVGWGNPQPKIVGFQISIAGNQSEATQAYLDEVLGEPSDRFDTTDGLVHYYWPKGSGPIPNLCDCSVRGGATVEGIWDL